MCGSRAFGTIGSLVANRSLVLGLIVGIWLARCLGHSLRRLLDSWRIYVSDGLHFGVDTFLAALPRLGFNYSVLLAGAANAFRESSS